MASVDAPFSSPLSTGGPASTYGRPFYRQDFQIAIICALSFEYDPAILLVDEFWDEDGRQYGRTSGDTNIYRNGRIGVHNVVLMLLPGVGKATVAGSAASLRASYPNLRLAFLVGVCGGVPIIDSHEALLGDVVIGEAIVQYDFGRRYPGEFVPKDTAEVIASVYSKEIRSLIAYFKSGAGRDDLRRNTAHHLKALQDAALIKRYQLSYRYPGFTKDKLFPTTYLHKHRGHQSCDLCCGDVEKFCDEAAQTSCTELGCDEDELVPRQRLVKKGGLGWEEAQYPDIIIGRVASADTVMKSSGHRDQIAKRYNVVAFEMEGAGLWDEAPCIVVKGICDYADSHKSKIWQPFAAATAAAAVKAILERYTLTDHFEPYTQSTDSGPQNHSPPVNLEVTQTNMGLSFSASALVRSNGVQILQDAIFDFKSALTDNQRHELRNINVVPDADAVLIFTAQLDSLNKNRKGQSIASRLHSVLQSVRDFSAAAESFISPELGVAPLLWGSVKLTMLAVVKFASYYEALSKHLMDLGRFCPRWAEYQSLYSYSTQLQKALCNFYASLIHCCKRVVQTVQHLWSIHIFNSPRESFELEFKRDVDNIKNYSLGIKEALLFAKAQVNLQNQQLQNRGRKEGSKAGRLKSLFSRKDEHPHKMETWQAQGDERRAKERRQWLLDSLSTHDYLTPLKQSRRKRHRGTSEWIFQTQEFDRWINTTDSPLLWCYGKIGSGKTILTASVIDRLLTEKRGPDIFISFFFVRFDDQQSLNAEVILKSIIRQTLNHSGLYDGIEALLEHMRVSLSSGLNELVELLKRIAATFKLLYIIIDGIDECEKSDRSDLLYVLSSLATIGSNTRLFLASRDSVSRELQKAFPTLNRLSMTCSSAQSDIAAYIESSVQEKLQSEELIIGDTQLIEDIKLALMEGADGMFLWVVFQLDELGLQRCDDDIRRAIRNFPKDLEETFDRAVGRIVSRGNENIAQQVFRWIAAAKEPLTLDQLREAIFIEIKQPYSKPERQSNGIEYISSWCENLVYMDEELKTVHFAHQTVRQFFLEKAAEASHNQFHINLDDVDHYIGEICVTYLNFNDFKTTMARRSRPLPPMPPAAIARTALRNQWKAAASIPTLTKSNLETWVSSKAAKAIGNLTSFQRDDAKEAKERLLVGYPFLRYASTHCISHTNMFQKGKSKTWSLWVKMMLEGHDLVDKPWGEGSFRETSSLILNWSQKSRHYALIQLILLAGILSDRDREQIMQSSAIEGDLALLNIVLESEKPGPRINQACLAAVKGGRLNTLERLLLAGARINAPIKSSGRTALQAAAEHGHLHITERLLIAGADVNAVANKSRGRTALQAAAEGGHLDVVEKLLAAGADVNAVPAESHGRTALQAAAEYGHLDVLERLLVNGAEVNAVPAKRDGRNALQAAAGRGHLDAVETLLAVGAEVNSMPAKICGRTALQAAAEGGHLRIVEALLAAGAEVNAIPAEIYGRTALQAAARYGHLDIIESLLAAGAGVNTSTRWHGQTALQAAAEGGHLGVTERLLAAGAAVNAPTRWNEQTALYTAAESGHLNVVERFLAAGAELSSPSEWSNRTALEAAAKGGYLDIIQTLLSAGAEANTPAGSLALQVAAKGGYMEIVSLLKESGARDKKSTTN